VTKLAAEHLCRSYYTEYGVVSVILRYFTIFGSRQRPDMAFSRFIQAAMDDEPIRIIGGGSQIRDFTYVDDAVAATIAAASRGRPGGVYNIAGGCVASIVQVVDTLERLFDRTLRREHLDPVPGDPGRTGADTSAARRDLEYQPKVTLEEGLKKQVEYILVRS
jgi:nucleoside-diphosphate-sugar epimerase